MKLHTLGLVLGLVVGLFASVALANGNGDVTVRVNGSLPDPSTSQVMIGYNATFIDIFITNDAPLYSISLALSFDMGDIPFHLESPYGMFPPDQPYVYANGPLVLSAFDPEGLQITTDLLPNMILIQGTATSHPLPVHTISTLCYSLRMHVGCSGPHNGTLSIDNIYIEPNGTWMLDDGTPYAPTFNGQPNSSITNPDAPAMIWWATIPPCGFPAFTVTPNAVEAANLCSGFEFTFAAIDDAKCYKGPLEFTSNVGNMNLTTGKFTLMPDLTCTPTAVIAVVTNSGCMKDEYTFTVNWVDTPPIFTNCPIMSAYVDTDDVYEYPFSVYDPDACDKVTYSVSNFGGGPHGAFAIDSTGKFVFTPTVDDYLYFYVFNLLASSGCGAIDSCQFRVGIGYSHCGDANGDWTVDISDVVHLITFIFNGGLPPNPPSEGDVDCSGGVDISDVVYIVTHIFSDGPGPCDGCK